MELQPLVSYACISLPLVAQSSPHIPFITHISMHVPSDAPYGVQFPSSPVEAHVPHVPLLNIYFMLHLLILLNRLTDMGTLQLIFTLVFFRLSCSNVFSFRVLVLLEDTSVSRATSAHG